MIGADIIPVEEEGTLRATVLAPAKLNLMLAVGAKRADGFHEFASILQTLDLADRLDVDIEVWDSDQVDVLVEAPGVPGGDTLVTRAVRELLERAEIGARVWITLEKEIPVGAGLGGGSSDAAAALRAVWALLGPALPTSTLHDIAAGIGSDVPFFLLGPGAAAYATGRGEVLEPIEPLAPRAWLLVNPNVPQPTAAVYARHDPDACDPLPASANEARERARRRPYRNDLARPAREHCPQLDRLWGAIVDAGGDPLVCGSGSTIAVRVRSREERVAYEGVARTAVPGCWHRVSWTTAAN